MFIHIAWNQQPMLTTTTNSSAQLAAKLLNHYSFDLSGYSASELLNLWQREYPLNWLHLAVIEALYQGRYKAISVQQILNMWKRREQASYHFNMEFERMICSKFPERLNTPSLAMLPPVKTSINSSETKTLRSLPVYSDSVYAQDERSQNQANRPKNPVESQTENSVFAAPPSFKIATESTDKQLALVAVQKQTAQDSQSLCQAPISLPMTQMLLASSNHPPIGQFTPETSGHSELFTSKLKAMVGV
jgi:hypothetical protein